MKILKVVSIILFITFLAISCGSGGGDSDESGNNNGDGGGLITTLDTTQDDIGGGGCLVSTLDMTQDNIGDGGSLITTLDTTQDDNRMAEVTVFDETFERDNGKPVTENRTFIGVEGTATIKLMNDRISSAIVTVNGQVIFDASDFNPNVDYLEKEIMLLDGQNILDVLLRSKPGDKLSVQIIMKDICVPGNPPIEVCDGLDNDCDGQTDEIFLDLGGSCTVGIGECKASGLRVCDSSGTGTTCDATAKLPTVELCDGKDNDCDGQIDEGVTNACGSCGAAPIEVCDGLDNDCDGDTDEGCLCIDGKTQSCGIDVGECMTGTQTCSSGKWSECVGEIGPSTEICDGKDNDCDGVADGLENLTRTCGTTNTGECSLGTESCNNIGNWVGCDAVFPLTEVCDGKDNDCDGSIDEGCLSCTDNDNDGYKLEGDSCGPVDCDDNNHKIYPGATEQCDGEDNDCDGSIDENVIIVIGDNDGYGYGSGSVPDNSNLPMAPANQQYCFDPSFSGVCNYNSRSSCVADTDNNCIWVDWEFNNQESAESGASNGAQYTDIVRYGPSFNFTINFSPLLNPGQAWFQLDVSGIQTSIWGASSIIIDGVNHTSMLPTEQGSFGSSVRTRLLDQNSVLDGSITVSIQGGIMNGGDAIAFDYFELGMTCEP